MKLSDWASIAEVISGIAVVITLVFLIVGIRENTEITRAAVFDRNISSINDITVPMVLDEEFAPLMQTYLEGRLAELSSTEWFRVGEVVRSLFREYESAYYANQYGNLGASEWTRFLVQMCAHRGWLGEKWEEIQSVITEEFANYTEASCSDEL